MLSSVAAVPVAVVLPPLMDKMLVAVAVVLAVMLQQAVKQLVMEISQYQSVLAAAEVVVIKIPQNQEVTQ